MLQSESVYAALAVILCCICTCTAEPSCAYTGSDAHPYQGPPFKPDPPLTECVQFADDNGRVCCDGNQTNIIVDNFKERVGPLLGSCPICVENLRKFWCGYTCVFNQGDFVKVSKYPPLATDFYVCKSLAEGLYESCQDVSFGGGATVKELWDTALKFLQLQGLEQHINPIIVDDSSLAQCFNAKIRPCQCGCDCNSCSATCQGVPCPDVSSMAIAAVPSKGSNLETKSFTWLGCLLLLLVVAVIAAVMSAMKFSWNRRLQYSADGNGEGTPLL
mmetsp:Transcript_25644/g.42975  ORF Transcript_25644/g.42975 Transcript_25644/m.42975 type:complete len:274 (+) Transcript_25644:58-879(+)